MKQHHDVITVISKQTEVNKHNPISNEAETLLLNSGELGLERDLVSSRLELPYWMS